MLKFEADRPERLDKFLSRMLPDHSRTKLARMATEGKVLVDGTAVRSSFALAPAMIIELPEPEEAPAHDLTPSGLVLDVRYEDDDLLVINKPRGLAVHPAFSLKEPSLVNALLGRSGPLSSAGGEFRPGIVHRLDKDTTGLIIVAKNDFSHVNLAKQIETKSAMRRYLAVIAGEAPHERFTVGAPIARSKVNRLLMATDALGKAAVTHFKRLAAISGWTLLGVSLETGRTHQIRVHLQSIGCPVLGDKLYAPKRLQGHPLQLHAAYLQFSHPRTGSTVNIFAGPPDDFLLRNVNEADLRDF